MKGRMHVISRDAFDQWLKKTKAEQEVTSFTAPAEDDS
jgi:heme/copper-type cytochrome/quinol oxidase subunit 2